MTRRITTRRRRHSNVLAWDEPDVVGRLRGMAEDHASGCDEDEVKRETTRGWAALEPGRPQRS